MTDPRDLYFGQDQSSTNPLRDRHATSTCLPALSHGFTIKDEGGNEIAEAIEFEGAHRLFPEAAALFSCLAQFQIDNVRTGDDLRRLLTGLIREARNITPGVPPQSGEPEAGGR